MVEEIEKGAVLFADLAGSTSLYETLGNLAARQAVRVALEKISRTASEQQGRVIKTMGDSVLAWFPAADDAARAAVSILQRTRRESALPVRVGFHFGEVIHEANDVFGDAVNVAARLTSTARAGEILTSGDTATRLSEPLAGEVREVDFDRFKGKLQPMRVCELQWEQGKEITRIIRKRGSQEIGLEEMRERMLRISHGKRQLVLTSSYMPHTFGRHSSASTRVDSSLVSRLHARLDFHHGKFVITDHSINGTYVTLDGGTEVFLCRESMPLYNRGTVSLGGKAESNPEVVIQFVCM